MPTVFDVAKYVLELYRQRDELPITTWKLQKLVYYAQAWSLVRDDEPLFEETIEAWANGPVCPDLYREHRGKLKISGLPRGDIAALSKDQRDTIDVVVEHYGKRSAQYLSELTHQEAPWKDARKGLEPVDRGSRSISLDSMAEYYGGL
jgi:uncharacterized phage-associated protein